jgi:hypothetical protein
MLEDDCKLQISNWKFQIIPHQQLLNVFTNITGYILCENTYEGMNINSDVLTWTQWMKHGDENMLIYVRSL